MDKLEEHIRKNRESFDRYNPSAYIGRRIGKDLKIKRSIRLQWISIAAMIIVILGTAILLF